MRRNISSPQESRSCPRCQGGLLRLEYRTHFTWLNDDMITVPDFPTWVCDTCGYKEEDERAQRWLSILLNPSLGKPVHKGNHKPRRPPASQQNSGAG